jgi:hypothetical protein
MNRLQTFLLAAAALLCAAGPGEAYDYFYSSPLIYAQSDGQWNIYGGAFDGYGYSYSGSMQYIGPISGANSNNYEIKAWLDIRASDTGTTALFFRAGNSSALGYGTYTSVELHNIQVSGTSCTATLVVNSAVNSAVTQIASTSIACNAGNGSANYTIVRGVIFGTNLWVFVNDKAVCFATVPLTSGLPGLAVKYATTHIYEAQLGTRSHRRMRSIRARYTSAWLQITLRSNGKGLRTTPEARACCFTTFIAAALSIKPYPTRNLTIQQ